MGGAGVGDFFYYESKFNLFFFSFFFLFWRGGGRWGLELVNVFHKESKSKKKKKWGGMGEG